MKDLTEVLDTINKATEDYRTLKLSFTANQSDILRDLSIAYKDLTDHKTEAGNTWLDRYNEHQGNNAQKERYADSNVREYDMIKDIMKSVEILIKSLVMTISANNKG